MLFVELLLVEGIDELFVFNVWGFEDVVPLLFDVVWVSVGLFEFVVVVGFVGFVVVVGVVGFVGFVVVVGVVGFVGVVVGLSFVVSRVGESGVVCVTKR